MKIIGFLVFAVMGFWLVGHFSANWFCRPYPKDEEASKGIDYEHENPKSRRLDIIAKYYVIIGAAMGIIGVFLVAMGKLPW